MILNYDFTIIASGIKREINFLDISRFEKMNCFVV